MTDPSVFGRLLTSRVVVGWVIDVLSTWLPSYLAEVERQTDVTTGTYPRPKSVNQRLDIDNWPEDKLPALIIVAGSIDPTKRDQGEWTGVFRVSVGVVVDAGGADPEASVERAASAYVTAIAGALLQHQSLGGNADRVDWIGAEPIDSASDMERSLMVMQVDFDVSVSNVLHQGMGPISPDPNEDPLDPYPDWSEVDSTDVTFDIKPPDEAL